MQYYKAARARKMRAWVLSRRRPRTRTFAQAAEYFAALKPGRLREGDRNRHAAEDVHRHRRPSSSAPSRRRHRADRPPHPSNPGRSVPHGNPGPAFRFHRLCAAGQHRQGRGAGEDRGIRKDGAMRDLSRRDAERPGRSAAARWPATAVYRAAALRSSEWLERRQGCGADESRVAKNLSDDDIIAISSYLGSLPPR